MPMLRSRPPCLPLLGLALLLAATLLGGCHLVQRRDGSGAENRTPLALVNGEPIYLEEYEADYTAFLRNWDRFIGDAQVHQDEVRRLVLDQVIELKLLDQEARRQGITVAEEEAAERVEEVLGPPQEEVTQERDTSRDNPALASWSREFRRRMLHQRLIERAVTEKIKVSDEELRAYYDAHKEDFDRPEQVRVRHIAVGTLDAYNKVLDLLEDGADFEGLARRYSITPDRQDGGDLGHVEAGVLPPEFDSAIFDMRRIGEVSGRRNPVQTQMGFHIFRLEGRRKAGQLPFEEARAEIHEILVQQKHPEAYAQWLAGLKTRARIEIHEDLLTARP